MDFLRNMLNAISSIFGRVLALIGISSGGISLTGILGLAVVLYGLYQLRGYAALPKPDGQQRADPNAPSTSRGTSAGQGTAATSTTAAQKSTSQPTGTPPASQTAAQRLAGIKRITLSVPAVLLEESTPENLSDSATLLPNAAAALKELSRHADVFLLAHIEDDIGEATVSGALDHGGILGTFPGQIPPHRLLFCSTLDGKISFVRQLEPDLHIDGHAKTVEDLQRFVRGQILIQSSHPTLGAGGSTGSGAKGNVERFQNIQQLVGLA